MMVDYSSRSRIAIEWYDDEAEADARARQVLTQDQRTLEAANLGIVQVGRDKGFDKTLTDGTRLYAVVTP